MCACGNAALRRMCVRLLSRADGVRPACLAVAPQHRERGLGGLPFPRKVYGVCVCVRVCVCGCGHLTPREWRARRPTLCQACQAAVRGAEVGAAPTWWDSQQVRGDRQWDPKCWGKVHAAAAPWHGGKPCWLSPSGLAWGGQQRCSSVAGSNGRGFREPDCVSLG